MYVYSPEQSLVLAKERLCELHEEADRARLIREIRPRRPRLVDRLLARVRSFRRSRRQASFGAPVASGELVADTGGR